MSIESSFEARSEYAPMSGLDDYLIHNGPLPVRVMTTSDPQAYERVWFTSFDTTGTVLICIGLGVYPNLGTSDAFAIVNVRGKHTTVRAQAPMAMNRLDMNMGPIHFRVVKPFEEWRLTLDETDLGVSFDIHWFDTKRAVFKQRGFIDDRLRSIDAASGYETFGNQEGWVRAGDDTFDLTRSEFSGTRDHHWGVRDNVGGPSAVPGMMAGHVHSGEFVEFPAFGIFSGEVIYNIGDKRTVNNVVEAKRVLDFEESTKMLRGGQAELRLDSGETIEYSFELLGQQAAHLRCGMYGGFGGKGGTPDGDIWHGQMVPELTVGGEVYDTTRPAVRLKICGLDDNVARFRTSDGLEAYGICETVNGVVYEAAVQGIRGLSLGKMVP